MLPFKLLTCRSSALTAQLGLQCCSGVSCSWCLGPAGLQQATPCQLQYSGAALRLVCFAMICVQVVLSRVFQPLLLTQGWLVLWVLW
jgi:hypothetical protein